MRCWALAEEFSARGASVTWQATIHVPWLDEALRQTDWHICAPHGMEHDQALAVDADLVVVDSYSLGHSYRYSLLQRGIRVVAVVDDSCPNAGPATVWVNPGAQSSLAVERESAFLNGPDYALIRRQVRDLRAIREQAEIAGAEHIGTTFLLGGTDFADFSQVISTISQDCSLPHPLYAGPAKNPQTIAGVSWIPGGPDLLRRVARSKFAVSASGVSSWELAHIGVPTALFQAVGNQAGNYNWMTQQRWAWPLGRGGAEMNVDKLADQLSQALAAIENGQLIGSSRIDGLGAQRVVDKCLD